MTFTCGGGGSHLFDNIDHGLIILIIQEWDFFKYIFIHLGISGGYMCLRNKSYWFQYNLFSSKMAWNASTLSPLLTLIFIRDFNKCLNCFQHIHKALQQAKYTIIICVSQPC